MIKETLVPPVIKHANKSFTTMCDPSKMTIQRIFSTYWNDLLHDPEILKRGLRPVAITEVEKMMACGTLDSGFEIFECPNCHKYHIICYTCTCGTKTAKQRAKYISEHTLNLSHRHIVFTLDERLRYFFQKDRELLHSLFDAAKETLFYTFDKMTGKKKSFKPAFILTLHTFGRDLKWNPHIHYLCTEGAMDDDHNYKPIKYINYESLRKFFMKQLLDLMKAFYSDDPLSLKKLEFLINTLYRDNANGFYVNAPKMKQNLSAKDAVINYIIRYTGRPVMDSSHIVHRDHDSSSIHYYYEDHKSNQRVEVKEDILTFMKKLLSQPYIKNDIKAVHWWSITSGETVNLKWQSQWEWVKAMNSIISRVEEIIKSEMTNI